MKAIDDMKKFIKMFPSEYTKNGHEYSSSEPYFFGVPVSELIITLVPKSKILQDLQTITNVLHRALSPSNLSLDTSDMWLGTRLGKLGILPHT